MKLLNYCPEVSRLRRVAKACAAGELSRTEYRQARRQVIQNMIDEVQGSDNTIRRLDGDTTVRRAPAGYVEARHHTNRVGWLWVALICVLLAAVTLPGVAWGKAGHSIPAMQDRDVNPATSPRYPVSGLHWTVPQAVADIGQDQVDRFLSEALATVQAASAPADHGFNDAELKQIGRFLNAIGVHDKKTRISREDMLDLQALVAQQKQRRGVSLAELEAVAERLQQWVRDQGYPLALAYVPSQQLQQGQVQLAVQVGVLSNISVDATAGLNAADSAGLGAQMRGLLGQPVRKAAVETRLNLLNRNSDHALQAGFQPGAQVGETELVLHFSDAGRFRGQAQIDNYAADIYDAQRLSYTASSSGLMRAGDRLALGLSTLLGGERNSLGGLRYQLPLRDHNITLGGQLAYADAQWQRDLQGKGVIAEFDAVQTRLFTRQQRRELRYRAGVHDLRWQGNGAGDQRLWFVAAGVQGHQLWDVQRWSLNAEAEAVAGGVNDTFAGQDDQFWRLQGSMRAWKPLHLARFDQDLKLVLNAQMQYSPQILPATQRVAVSTPLGNSGLPAASLFADSALAVGARVQLPAPMGEWWLGLDNTFAQNNDAADTWFQLLTASVGWQATLWRDDKQSLDSRISVGYPFTHRSNGDLRDDGTQIYWSLKFSH